MKKITYILLLLIAGNIAAQNREFTVSGKLPDLSKEGYTVYLRGISNFNKTDIETRDTAKVINGKFTLTDSIDSEADIRIINLEDTSGATIASDLFIVQPGIVNLTFDSVATVSGTLLSDEHQSFRDKQDVLSQKIKEIDNKAKTLYVANMLTEDDVQRFQSEMQDVSKEFVQIASSYIRKNIKNGVGEFYFIYYSSILPPAQLKELYALSNPTFQQSESVKFLMNTYSRTPGDDFKVEPFKDIELSNLDGQKVKLSDYVGKGKIVFVDFWASWCGPCRKDMPSVVALYNKYKDKDFEIVGISLDENKSSWIAAVQAMNMSWINISDLKGWNSAAARLYEVNSIPQSFLIDKDGNIVAHNLRGNDLTSKIDELLKNETVNTD